ncbi:MAG TPA: ABC transporter substrate-binding protein [Noviherbaspirillum sp.]|uniref:ABC transporter substrate-binding protein n=1 Tax=Noviherbaspirillum sp. TaxID=1926288 RepID=UPI002F94C386
MLSHLKRLTCAGLLLLSAAAPAAEPIVVGQAIDLSGPDGGLGRDYVAGIKTCFDMVNAAGGVNGRRIRFIARDDRGEPAASAAAAEELLEREQADFLLGGIGDAAVRAVTASQAFRRKGQVLFAPLASGEQSHGGRVLYWRPGYKQEIRHIFSHFRKLGISDVGVVYQDGETYLDAWRSVQAEAAERQVRLSHTARLAASGERAAQEAKRMADARPGFVLVIGDSIATALFLKAYRRHDGQTFVAGTSLTNLETLRELAGRRAVEWTVFSQVVPNPGAGSTVLQIEHLAMMRKYRDESVSALTLEGFAAARSLVKMMQASTRSGPAMLREFLARGASIDIGGMTAGASPDGRLSGYLDIALLSKGSGLVY